MSDAFYRELVIDHARHPRCFGTLERPTFSVSSSNPTCGDRFDVDVEVGEDGAMIAMAFRGVGCAISTASGSLLAEHVAGQSVDTVSRFSLATIETLLGVPIAPMRTQCALLVLTAVQKGIQIWKTDSSSIA